MGVSLNDFVEKEPVELSDLHGTVAIDSFNWMYQFLYKIRDHNTGKPLSDDEGHVTSHLVGIFYRTVNMLEVGAKPVFVWEGDAPELKNKELIKRREVKEAAEKALADVDDSDIEKIRELSMAKTRITKDMQKTAARLVEALGCPFIIPPSESEAQCAAMCEAGLVDYTISQDYDALLFGSPNIIQNLNSDGGEKIELQQILDDNDLTEDQLIELAILLGTDFNESPKGVGPKTALKYVKESDTFDEIFEKAKAKDDSIDYKRWNLTYDLFKDGLYDLSLCENLEWQEPDKERVVEILVGEHGFTEERVRNALDKLP